jgi:multidrug efflux system outer membrane protein
MRKSGLLFLLVSLFIWPFDGNAARRLSLDSAVDLVVQESNDIRRAEANVRRMQAILDGARSARWLNVDANAAYTNLIDMDDRAFLGTNVVPWNAGNFAVPNNIGTVGLSAAQPIFTFGQISNAVEMARGSLRIAETSRHLAQIETRAAAVQLYWSAKMMDDMVVIAQRALRNTQEAQRQLTATGRANRANLVRISTDVASREIELNDAKFNRDSAFRMLKVFAGIDEDERIVLTTNFPATFPEMVAQDIRPLEWDILGAQVGIFEAERRRDIASRAPTIVAFGSYDYRTFGSNARDLGDLYQHQANVGLAVTMPLFDAGRRRSAATASAMSAIAAREDLDRSQRLRTAEYNDLIQRHAHLRRSLTDLRNAKDLASRTYQLSRDRFLAGQTSAVELSDVERGLTQMEMAILNTKLQILTTTETIRKLEVVR